MTHAAPDGVFDGQAAQTSGRGPGGEQKGLGTCMRLANAAAAKSADSVGGRTTDPAAHSARLPFCGLTIGGWDSGQVAGEALHQVARDDDVQANFASSSSEGFVTTVTADR